MFSMAYGYADAAEQVLTPGTPAFWANVVLQFVVLIASAVFCFRFAPQWIPRDVEQMFPDLYKRLHDEKRWDAEMRGVQIQYVPYFLYTIACAAVIAVAFVLFVFGAWGDMQHVQEQQQRLVANSLPDHVDAIDADVLFKAERLVSYYTVFREELIKATNHYLLVMGLFLLVFIWILGTQFQTIFGPPTVNVFRILALVFTFVLLPIGVFYGYYQLVSNAEMVGADIRQLVTSANLQDRANNEALGELNALWVRLVEQASVTGFVWRLASSWGGLLLFGEYLFGWLVKRFARWSVFRNIIPRMRAVDWLVSIGEAIFSEPPRSTGTTVIEATPTVPPPPRHPFLDHFVKAVTLLSFLVLWMIVYKFLNNYNADPSRAIHWNPRPVDVWPGFIQPWTAIIYTLLGYPILLWPFVYNWSWPKMTRVLTAYAISSVIGFGVYCVFPLAIRRPDFLGGTFGDWIMLNVVAVDNEANCCPSFHTSFAILAALFVARGGAAWGVQALTWVVAIAICLTTITTGQHYFIDVVGGVVNALVSFWAAEWLVSRSHAAAPSVS